MHRKLPKLDLNVTNRCNLRCRHCAFDSGVEKMPDISLCLLKRLLRETRALGGERIDITGGEPALRRDLDRIVEAAKEQGFKVELVTNGTLLDRKRIGELRSSGLDAVAMSVDGPSVSSHALVRGTGQWEFWVLLDNLSYAVQAGLYTKVNTLAHSENFELIPEIAELCLKRNVSELGIYYFTPVGRGYGGGLDAVEPGRWLSFVRKELHGFQGLLTLSVEIPLIERTHEMGFCGCILEDDPFHLQILPSGDIYPCAILASYHIPIGNLTRCSVGEIWNDEGLWRKYRSRVNRQVFRPRCSACVSFANFSLKDYPGEEYKFVCPLRKYTPEQLMETYSLSAAV